METEHPSPHVVEIALKLQKGSVLAQEVLRLQELLAGLPEGWTADDEARRLAFEADKTREMLELLEMRRRLEFEHEKARRAAETLSTWNKAKDEGARIVLYAKWGSAIFYRDKFARILGLSG